MSLEQTFIPLVFGSLGLEVVVNFRVLFRGQIDLFKNHLYLIGILEIIKPCATTIKNYTRNVTKTYNVYNSLYSGYNITLGGLTRS